MCGIFGQGTNTPRKINQGNIKILGMANETRGKDSCGITFDGQIYHGIDDTKLFKDFIKGKQFNAKNYPIMFGHTRNSSVGSVSDHNCHPFGFGKNKTDTGYKFIGVHNGTLFNHEELAEKYKLDITATYTNTDGKESIRRKIDSEIILGIIHKTKNVRVLSEYLGKAALVWTDTDMPDTIYLWSGKSKMYPNSLEDSAQEERPLFVYVESKNSFYFSSLEDSLHIIGGNSDNTAQIEYNTLYTVKNGDFKNAKKFKISRKNCYNTEAFYGGKNSACGTTKNGVGCTVTTKAEKRREIASRKWNAKHGNSSIIPLNPGLSLPFTLDNIHNDVNKFDINSYGNKTYSRKFRYWRNGHVIEGVYIYIHGFGFYLLGQTYKEALEHYHFLVGKEFFFDIGSFNTSGKDFGKGKVLYQNPDVEPMLFYFYKGIMLKDKLDYAVLINAKSDNAKTFESIAKLSYLSCHPVVDLSYSRTDNENQGIYKEGVLYTGSVDGLLFERKYFVKDGNLYRVEEKSIAKSPIGFKALLDQRKEENNLICAYREDSNNSYPKGDLRVIAASVDFIVEMEDSIQRTEDEHDLENEINWQEAVELNRSNQNDDKFLENMENAKNTEQDINQLVEEKLNEYLLEPLKAFQNCKQELEIDIFKGNKRAKEAIMLLDNMSNFLREYIEKE